jgi:hypothetical protein
MFSSARVIAAAYCSRSTSAFESIGENIALIATDETPCAAT